MKITLATGNKHKVEEINLIAKDYGVEFVLPNGEFNPIEDGDNFIDNAICKAKHASKNGETELYLADDSGLCIDFLNGEPGIYSARYEETPIKRINKVLNKLQGVKNRKAHFACAMAIVNKKGEVVYRSEKYCFGSILNSPKGNGGFGYDPIFFVDETNCAMAELTDEQKSKVSHRAKTLNDVLNWLKNNKTY